MPGNQIPALPPEIALYKFSSTGSLVWQEQFNIQGQYSRAVQLAVAPDGNIFLGGDFTTNVTTDLFYEKRDGTTGNLIWQQTQGTAQTNYLGSITADANGDLYTTETSSDSSVWSLVKLDGTTGTQTWTTPLAQAQFPLSLTAANGAVIVGGAASSQIVFLGPAADQSETGFISSFSTASGSQNWTQTINTGQGDAVTGLSASSSGDIYATGVTNGILASGFSQPTQNYFLLDLTSAGAVTAASQFGTGSIIGATAQYPPLVTSAQSGEVYVGGPIQKPFPDFTNSTNELQMFVARFR